MSQQNRLTALYQHRGYEPFHTAVNPLGVERVYFLTQNPQPTSV